MADNTNSPLDLGTLLINGNDAMLSNKSQSNPQSVLTNLLAMKMSDQGNVNQALPSAAIDAASKVQKNYYTQHAQDLVDNNPDGISVLNKLLDSHNANNVSQPTQQQQQVPEQKSLPLSIDDQIAQINKQSALNVAKANLSASQPPGFFQRFGNNLAKMEGAVTQSERIQDLAAVQKIAGNEPLQPKDVATLNSGSYTAALNASHEAVATEATKLNSLTQLYGQLNETKGLVAKGLNKSSEEQNKVLESAKASADNLSTHLSNLRTLISHRPTFNSQGMNSQAQATTDKINQGKVGKYTLVSK